MTLTNAVSEVQTVEHLGISYPVCAFPLQSSEILRAVKLCHLCDLSDSFGEGGMCDNSVAVVWFPVRLGFQHICFKREERKKIKRGLTSKIDTSFDSPGNHKITPLKTAESAISVSLSSFKKTRMKEGPEKSWAWNQKLNTRCMNVGTKQRMTGECQTLHTTHVNGNFISSFVELGLHTKIKSF